MVLSDSVLRILFFTIEDEVCFYRKRGESVRCGALAVKIGMKMEVDWWGRTHPVTVLQLQDNQVRFFDLFSNMT